MDLDFLHCMECGKQVSTGFFPANANEGLVVRAAIICPECIDKLFGQGKDASPKVKTQQER